MRFINVSKERFPDKFEFLRGKSCIVPRCAKKIFLPINIFLGWIVWQNRLSSECHLNPRVNATATRYAPSLHAISHFPLDGAESIFLYGKSTWILSTMIHWFFQITWVIWYVSFITWVKKRCWRIRARYKELSPVIFSRIVWHWSAVCSIHRRQPWEIRCTNTWEKPPLSILLFSYCFWEERRMCKWSKIFIRFY